MLLSLVWKHDLYPVVQSSLAQYSLERFKPIWPKFWPKMLRWMLSNTHLSFKNCKNVRYSMAVLDLMASTYVNISHMKNVHSNSWFNQRIFLRSIVILFLYFQCSLLFFVWHCQLFSILQYTQIHFILEDIFGGAPP